MTSVSLHEVPDWRTVVREQWRAVGLALRGEIVLVVGLLVVFLVVAALTAIRAARDPHMNVGFMYGPAASIPTSILALLIPFGVWRSEEPSRRDYHWSMPVAQVSHTLTKVLLGWAWLMLLVGAYVLFLLALWANATFVAGEPVHLSAAPWEWLVPFAAATVAYLVGSVFVVGSDHPWRWIMGVTLAFLLVFAFLSAVSLDDVRRLETSILSGRYGLNAALFGQVEGPGRNDGPSLTRWLTATVLWAALAGAALGFVSSRGAGRSR